MAPVCDDIAYNRFSSDDIAVFAGLRFQMLRQITTHCRQVFLVALATCLMPVLPISADDTAVKNTKPKSTRLRGYVQNESKKSIAGAVIRIAIPDADMRFVHAGTKHRVLETTTNDEGQYSIAIEDIKEPTKVSIDAMAPGYQRLVGTLMQGGDAQSVELIPGSIKRANLTLKQSLYFTGIVVDTDGKPIANVSVSGNLNSARAAAGVERTATDAAGRFQLFNYTETLRNAMANSKGAVEFFHQDYLRGRIDDIYLVKEQERETIRIVLPKGDTISGTLTDAAGKPAIGQIIKVAKSMSRKAVLTDKNGSFKIQGVPPGKLELTSMDFKNRQKLSHILEPNDPRRDLKLQLQAINLPEFKVHSLLGMKLANVTPDMKEAFNLFMDQGVLIVDPGQNCDRFKIGDLFGGYSFWMVGQRRIHNIREFAEELLAESANPQALLTGVRVVYNFSNLQMDGSNTQYMRLTFGELAELRKFLDETENAK